MLVHFIQLFVRSKLQEEKNNFSASSSSSSSSSYSYSYYSSSSSSSSSDQYHAVVKATSLQAWTGPEGSRRLRHTYSKTVGT